MSERTKSRVLMIVVVLVLVGVGVYWLGSGKLMQWLLALHGKH